MDIDRTVQRLIRDYETSDPFRLARDKQIVVLYEDLGNYRGYYNKVYRHKFIHIHEDLDEVQKKITCAHELGHSILHTNTSTPYMRSNTFYSTNRYEREANLFASHLLITDAFIQEHLDCYGELNIFRIAGDLMLPVELVKLKLNVL